MTPISSIRLSTDGAGREVGEELGRDSDVEGEGVGEREGRREGVGSKTDRNPFAS